MSSVSFQIFIDKLAAESVKRMLQSHSDNEDCVLTVAPCGPVKVHDTLDEALASIKDYIEENKRTEMVVGISFRNRFPETEIEYFEGIPCFFSDDVRSAINGQTLVMDAGRPVFRNVAGRGDSV